MVARSTLIDALSDMRLTRIRRSLLRLWVVSLGGALCLGVLGPSGVSATWTYPTAAMILHNVPPAELLANKYGVCDGSFNIVMRNVGGAAGALSYLDAAKACGLKVILYFSSTADLTTGVVYPSRVAALVRAVKSHPALYGYLSVKEPSWLGITGSEIRALYKAYRAADPGHPVIALFGDISHFGDTRNPYTAGLANVVMVDWYPVETASGGCSTTGTSYVTTGPKWYSTKVRPVVALKTPGVPVWVMVQTHKYLKSGCHKKQRPSWSLLNRQIKEAFTYAHAKGIAFQTFRNTSYTIDEYRDPTMVSWMKTISAEIRAGTY